MTTMAKLTVADLARKMCRLKAIPFPTEAEENELKFYFQVLQKLIENDGVNNLVPLEVSFSVEDATEWAIPLGMHVVQGGSGTIYLSWAKGLCD